MAKQLLKERLQQLAGIKPLYENEEGDKTYINDNGTEFRPISKEEFGLEEFGVVGIFKDDKYPEQDLIVDIMYDGGGDFDSDEEEEEGFNKLFQNPKAFEELLWRNLYDSYRRISNKDRFSLKEIIPVTYLKN